MRAVAKRLALTVLVLGAAISGTYVATHTHPYNGVNVGIVVDAPGHGCIGVEYWRDTRAVDAYAGDVC